MKIGAVQENLKNRGFERGTQYVLELQQEQINTLKRQVKELTQMTEQLVDTLQNVVNGAVGMKEQMMKTLASNGLVASPEDDLDPSTHNL